MTDDTNDTIIQNAVGELDTAQNQTTIESYRSSLQGWRQIAGSTLGFAVFVDLMFIAAGYWLITNIAGTPALAAGGLAAGVGVLGLAEKTYRRVQ